MARTKVSQSVAQGLAPIPTATASAVGEWKHISSASGDALALPAGGTWAYFCFYRKSDAEQISSISGGVAAGGTTLLAGSGGLEGWALVWRVS